MMRPRYFILHLKSLLQHGTPFCFTRVFLEICAACNRACCYCPVAEFPSKQKLASEEVLTAFFKSVRGFTGVLGFHIYNEPLLHPHLRTIIKRTRAIAPHAELVCYSNGDRLDEDVMNEMCSAGLDYFFVTRHPPTNLMWDERIANLTRRHPKKVRMANIKFWVNRGGLVNEIPVNSMSGATSCRFPEGDVNIRLNGDVMLCCNDFHNEHTVGNILNQPLTEIYYSKEMRRTRAELRRGEFKRDLCKKCVSL